MINKEVLNLNNIRTVAMATLAFSGGVALSQESAFATGTNRAPISCPDANTAQDPSSDPCNGLEDGTVITVTDYNDYPATDPGTKNTHFAYPNGDSEDKLNTSYGVRDTYHHASGSPDNCNVFPSDGSTTQECGAYDAAHNGTTGTGTTGGTGTGTTGTGTTGTGTTGGTGTGGETTPVTTPKTPDEIMSDCVTHASKNYGAIKSWKTAGRPGSISRAVTGILKGTPLSKYENVIHCNSVDEKITRYTNFYMTVGTARKVGTRRLTNTARIANPTVGREALKSHSKTAKDLKNKAVPCGVWLTGRYVTHAEAIKPSTVGTEHPVKIVKNQTLKPLNFKIACK